MNLMKLKPFATLFSGFGILGIAAFITSSTLFVFLQKHSAVLENPTLGVMVLYFIVISFTMAFGLTPTTFVCIITGHFFSWTGLAIIIIAYVNAAVIGMLVFRKFNKRLFRYVHEENKKFASFAKGLEERQFQLIMLLRLSPIFPFAIMNLLLSTLKINWNNYLVASVAGMLPRTIIFFIAGKNARDIWDYVQHPDLEGLDKLWPILLIIVSVTGIGRIVKKSLDRERRETQA